MIDGELEVCEYDNRGGEKPIGTLTRGHTFGEFCVVACAKAQTIVRARTSVVLVDVPMEACESLILSRPDVVDDMHDIKLIFRRRHVPVEMQARRNSPMLLSHGASLTIGHIPIATAPQLV